MYSFSPLYVHLLQPSAASWLAVHSACFCSSLYAHHCFCLLPYPLPAYMHTRMHTHTHTFRYGVESFVTALFSYRGQGSLSHYLKITNPWATALLLEKSKDTSGFALFSFIILLTQDGVANIEDVVAGVFGYIEMLKASDDEDLYAVWEGKTKLDKIKFDYASPPSDISSYVK